jgi:RNA polymerase sigma factor (sigma-70 family)
MVMVRQDAEDVTQEILIKVLTKLGTYDPAKAGFRTWLYRIVANHVINMKTRGYERSIPPLERYYDFVAAVPDEEPDGSPETQLVVADVATGCIMGVLLCLEREQRLAFILAVAFNVTDAQGSFEVDARFVVLATLTELAQDGQIDRKVVVQAIEDLKIDPEKPNPVRS